MSALFNQFQNIINYYRRGMICVTFAFLILANFNLSHGQTDDDGPLFEIEFDKTELLLPCPTGCKNSSLSASCSDVGALSVAVKVVSTIRSRTETIWYEFEPEAGSVTQTGSEIKWDLNGAGAGTHWLKIKMNQGFETIEATSKSVTVGRCDCTCNAKCATFRLESETKQVVESQTILLRAIQSGYFADSVGLSWNIANGEILSGQGTNIVRVRAGSSESAELLVNLQVSQPSIECEKLFQLRVPIIPANVEDP